MGKSIVQYCKNTDVSYLLLCAALSAISVATLVSVGQYGGISYTGTFGNWKPAVTQALAAGGGVVAAILLSLVNYRRLIQLWPIHVALCWGLVLLTFIPGIGYEPAGTGSQSWIALPFGMSLQPTELAKVSFCLTFAGHLERVQSTINHPKSLLPLLAHLAAPVLLIHFQGDDGGAAVFLAMGIVMLVMAGLNRWIVAGCGVAVFASLPLLWNHLLSDHQKSRILGLINPEGYELTTMLQQLKGRTAIGSGSFTGRGLFQPDHYYVPRSENDFIFSYFAESCGFIGCVVLLALLLAVTLKTLFTAGKAFDNAGAYICIGIFATLVFQSVINIGMNLMLVPVMGVTLPFMSAGGTSVLMLYLSVGLLLSVGRHRKKTLFERV